MSRFTYIKSPKGGYEVYVGTRPYGRIFRDSSSWWRVDADAVASLQFNTRLEAAEQLVLTKPARDYHIVMAYYCDSCEAWTVDDSSGGPLYECGNCGTEFNRENSYDGSSHKCPDCGKFGQKLVDESCPNCLEQTEYTLQEAVFCVECSDFIGAELYEEHWEEFHATVAG